MDEQEFEFKDEAKAFERVAGGILGTKIDSRELYGKKLGDIYKKLKNLNMPPEEKLSEAVNALARTYNSNGIFKFGEENIEEMLSSIYKLDKPKVINPVGYILGYASRGGNTARIVNKVKSGEISDANAKPVDVIRYAKLWNNL